MKKSDFKFKNPYIKESIFKLNEGYTHQETTTIKTNIRPYHNYIPEADKPSAICGLVLEVGTETPESPFYIRLVMEALFAWENKEDGEIHSFLNINAPSLLAGYARPIIAFLTANSPYPPFHLSFINFKE